MADILILDDSYAIRENLKSMFSTLGHKVDVAENGVQGEALHNTNHYQFIISDIIMPNQEGLETIKTIRKKDSDVTIIAISGGGPDQGENYLKMARLMGADYGFKKPFRFEEFVESVHHIIGEKIIES